MTTYNKNNPNTIQEMFNSIAKNYDKTNAILSFQMHKYWNSTLVKHVLNSNQPNVILDLCCGTGAIAFEHLKKINLKSQQTPVAPQKVYMLDFSKEMLAFAKEKAKAEHLENFDISYLQADAQSIPLANNLIDCATIAYGIRNVKQPLECIKEVYRVLKPNGTFGILELTQPSHPFLRFGHAIYLRTFLPIMGKIFTSNQAAYQYLCNSIHSFTQPKALATMMESTGFKEVKCISLMGGVATILIGKK